MADAPTRPVLRYHGGKWKLAPWILSHFPDHRVYVEPFGGAASVLLRKPPAYAEVYNDLSGDVVTLFRVLRDAESARTLFRLLRRTPFARDEFNAAYEPCDEPIERSRRLIIRAFMGHGSDGAHSPYRTGFRANSNKSGSTPAHDWINLPRALAIASRRLVSVVIENRDALVCMIRHDSAKTLHFLDPPYVHATRSRAGRRPGAETAGVYEYEMTDNDHRAMADCLHALQGMVVLSGYPSPLYDDELFPDWRRIEREAHADGARKRTEVLWLNEACAAALDEQRAEARCDLFHGMAAATP